MIFRVFFFLYKYNKSEHSTSIAKTLKYDKVNANQTQIKLDDGNPSDPLVTD